MEYASMAKEILVTLKSCTKAYNSQQQQHYNGHDMVNNYDQLLMSDQCADVSSDIENKDLLDSPITGANLERGYVVPDANTTTGKGHDLNSVVRTKILV
jgi:hypothetical protein